MNDSVGYNLLMGGPPGGSWGGVNFTPPTPIQAPCPRETHVDTPGFLISFADPPSLILLVLAFWFSEFGFLVSYTDSSGLRRKPRISEGESGGPLTNYRVEDILINLNFSGSLEAATLNACLARMSPPSFSLPGASLTGKLLVEIVFW